MYSKTSPVFETLQLAVDNSSPPDWCLMDDGMPVARWEHGAVYDPVHRVIVVFGGEADFGDDSCLNDTWLYHVRSQTWERVHTDVYPEARACHAMVYDRANGSVVLFGGWTSQMRWLNDTWTFNVTERAWKRMNPTIAPPSGYQHAVSYDEENEAVVLFGGTRGNETWTYHTSNNTWSEMRPENPPTQYGVMAYDPEQKLHVFFGGFIDLYPGDHLNQTWTYDLNSNVWTEREPSSPPPSRSCCAMVYDREIRSFMLFGGDSNVWHDPALYNDTWSYDTSSDTWSRLSPLDPPPPRQSHVLVYADDIESLVMYGGRTYPNLPVGRVDILDSYASIWTWVEPVGTPAPRACHTLAYDREVGKSVLFGGFGDTGVPMNDTWAYMSNRSAWTKQYISGAPSPRGRHAMVYDTRNKVFILFGGTDGSRLFNDTWVYDLRSNRWTKKSPEISPSARSNNTMTFDTMNGVVILFGGDDENGFLNDTWTYHLLSDTWLRLVTGPSPPWGHAKGFAFDEESGVAVLFCRATYIFNLSANAWTRMETTLAPTTGWGPVMVYDSMAKRVMMHGGSPSDSRGALWSYDVANNSWTEVPTRTPLDFRYGLAMAYDINARYIILNRVMGDTWAFGRFDHLPSGTYLSEPHDCGGAAYYGNISWGAWVYDGTEVMLQLRTAATLEGLTAAPFLGPDSTPGTYFNQSVERQPAWRHARIPSVHNGTRWVQYKVYLSTDEPRTTPFLWTVKVNYNLIQSVIIAPPAGGESWNASHTIEWTAGDLDRDELTFDVYLLNGTDSVPLATGLPDGTGNLTWDTSMVPNGTYRVMVSAADDNADLPLRVNAYSGEFQIRHPSVPNHPPTAILLAPNDDETLASEPVTLVWSAHDDDGDPVSFTVFLSTVRFIAATLPPPLTTTTASMLELQDLGRDAWYYWTVVPSDGFEDGPMPAVRRFMVVPPAQNEAPVATLIGPTEGAAMAPGDVTLLWEGSDANGDTVRYFLHTSTTSFDPRTPPPGPIATAGTSHTLHDLADGTVIWWAVVPNDGKVNGSISAVWHFRVETLEPPPPVNHAPRILGTPPQYAVEGRSLEYNVSASDEDGDVLAYSLLQAPAGMDIDPSTGRLTWTPEANQLGEQVVRVVVEDGRDGVASQHFVITVREASWRSPTCSIGIQRLVVRQGEPVTFTGTAIGGSGRVVYVQLRVDGGVWFFADGLEDWTVVLDSGWYLPGTHQVEARAFDGTAFSDPATAVLVVERPETVGGTPLLWFLVVAIGVALCLVVAKYVLKGRSKGS